MNNSSLGFSVTIHIPTGDPAGLRIVGNPTSKGEFIFCSRKDFPEQKKCFDRAGVYLLLSADTLDFPDVYIGEGDPILHRIEAHWIKKDFWQEVIGCVGAGFLNKALVQYIEARLVKMAKEAGRCKLQNGNDPQLPTLSPAEVSVAENYLRETITILKLSRVAIFEKPPSLTSDSKIALLTLKGKKCLAKGYETSEGFVVLAGSQATSQLAKMMPKSARLKREEMIAEGLLEKKGDLHLFTKDFVSTSPSSAAAIILGYAVSGREEWKDDQGRSLKKLEALKLGN